MSAQQQQNPDVAHVQNSPGWMKWQRRDPNGNGWIPKDHPGVIKGSAMVPVDSDVTDTALFYLIDFGAVPNSNPPVAAGERWMIAENITLQNPTSSSKATARKHVRTPSRGGRKRRRRKSRKRTKRRKRKTRRKRRRKRRRTRRGGCGCMD